MIAEYNKVPTGDIAGKYEAYQTLLQKLKDNGIPFENLGNLENIKGELNQGVENLKNLYSNMLSSKENIENKYKELTGKTLDSDLQKYVDALTDFKVSGFISDEQNAKYNLSNLKDADGNSLNGYFVLQGDKREYEIKPEVKKGEFGSFSNDYAIITDASISIPEMPVKPDPKPDIDDKPTLPDQKPDEGGDNPNQGGDNTVDIDNDTSNVIYSDNQEQDEEEDEEENKLGLDETQAQEKGVLCVVSDDFRTMNICAIK
ncbi:hypothetical protein D4S19_02095 [Campylobacter jejuni]|nr:hypothetical protein [Campylobacter jejuni]